MSDAILAYLISLGIIGTGVTWILVGINSATSAIWITIGVVSIAVGLVSLVTELRNKTH